MSIRSLVVCAALMIALAPSAASAAVSKSVSSKAQPTCNLPQSDAEAIVILSNYYPGYWWDHTDLTIAIQPHPQARMRLHHLCQPRQHLRRRIMGRPIPVFTRWQRSRLILLCWRRRKSASLKPKPKAKPRHPMNQRINSCV